MRMDMGYFLPVAGNAARLGGPHGLEATDHGVERIAAQAGFGSATAFRERFKRVVGVPPQSYRASFRPLATDAAP
ncbi:helix-turn-helix domain-containing protein [Nonomuraea sp. NPDC052265]|uniref:helix-turn-helix domain-containing protein n=1 Tax=Nonomuraea sp. NPDC052265 TaxID=3364374 RepID=UPI0037C6D82B